jgi:cytidylate kinase
MTNFIVTLDGPAGSGKTTIAKELGLRLNWFVLQSGTIYRAVALIVREKRERGGGGGDDIIEAAREAASGRIEFIESEEGPTSIAVDGRPVGSELKSQEIGEAASLLAANGKAREALLPLQRSILDREKFLIAEGRDMGTVVFPEADVKIYLTASMEVRAKRRLDELRGLGYDVTRDEMIRLLRQRDERDEKRDSSPLKPAENAVILDASEMGIREVVSELIELISPRVNDQRETELLETRFRE